MNLILDPDFALCDHMSFDPTLLNRNHSVCKAKATKDPDTPTFKEAMWGPHREEFLAAMRSEIQALDGKGTWEVVPKSSIAKVNGKLPNIIPTTWAFRIKRYPDG